MITQQEQPALEILTRPKTSPERSFPKRIENADEPGLVRNNVGTSWAGVMSGGTIVDNGGITYGNTNINLSNPDNRARIDRAKEPLKGHSFYASDPKQQAALLNRFAANLHRKEVVGTYFSEVLILQAQQENILQAGRDRILNPDQLKAIRELREQQVAFNTLHWARRDDKGVVQDESVEAIEENNETTALAILQIEIEAATSVIGIQEADKRINAVMRGVTGLSEIDQQRRIAAELTEAAAQKNLTAEETAKLETLKAREDAAWNKKHENQTDFADAIRDGNPDCSEYASMTAVSLAESGIKNVRVMGHVMADDDFPLVGAHAYNVILDETGAQVIGVFEGTATSGAYRQVMNPMSLADFESGKTLVTFNEESGWATYGTGAPANGKNLDHFIYDEKNPDNSRFVSDDIEAHDKSLIADAKEEYIKNLSPEATADQLIGIYAQYGNGVRVQDWVDNIRDGVIPGDNTNPALAQAAQILHDYNGPMPPPIEMRERIIKIVSDSQARAGQQGNYDLAITPEVLQELERPAAASLAANIKEALDSLSPAQQTALAEGNPAIAEILNLSQQIGNVPYAYSRTEKTAFDHARDGNPAYLEAYRQIASVVKAADLGENTSKEIQLMLSTPTSAAPATTMALSQ